MNLSYDWFRYSFFFALLVAFVVLLELLITDWTARIVLGVFLFVFVLMTLLNPQFLWRRLVGLSLGTIAMSKTLVFAASFEVETNPLQGSMFVQAVSGDQTVFLLTMAGLIVVFVFADYLNRPRPVKQDGAALSSIPTPLSFRAAYDPSTGKVRIRGYVSVSITPKTPTHFIGALYLKGSGIIGLSDIELSEIALQEPQNPRVFKEYNDSPVPFDGAPPLFVRISAMQRLTLFRWLQDYWPGCPQWIVALSGWGYWSAFIQVEDDVQRRSVPRRVEVMMSISEAPKVAASD